MAENIHLVPNRLNRNINIFLLFIPIIVFVLILATISTRLNKVKTQEKGSSLTVLGQETLKQIKLKDIALTVEVADTPEEREKGLSGRFYLNKDRGMLFVFDQKGVYPTFWMKAMLIPIDIVWIKDLKITKIDRNVEAPKPGASDKDLTLYYPDSPIDYVLEVNAGFSDKNNLAVDDSVTINE